MMKSLRLGLLALGLVLCIGWVHAQNQNVSGGIVFEGEPYLAQDPTNPSHLVVAWIGFVFQQPASIKTRTSFDGGMTWSTVSVLSRQSPSFGCADPSLGFDVNGDVLACYVAYRESPDSGGVYVCRSTNGGLTWDGGVKVIDAYDDGGKRPLDRPWMTIDRSQGSARGYIYITTKPAPWIAAPNRPYFMRSTDAGQTWSNWQYLDGPGFLVGNLVKAPMATPIAGADGSLNIAYPSYLPSQNVLPGYYLARSTDGGATFNYHPMWFAIPGAADSLIKAGYQLLADPSDPSHLAFLTPINLLGDQDIYLIESMDAGLTWQSPLRINDDAASTGVTQDLVWGDFDNDGDLVVTWRDRRNAGGAGYQVASEIFGAVRWKDSTQFSPNFPISDTLATWNVVLTQAGNDFMSTQFENDTLCAAWGDTRNGRLNIWFAKMDLRNQTPTGIFHLADEGLPEINIYPNPSAESWQVEGTNIVSLQLYDLQGRRLMQQTQGPIDCRHLPKGSYLLQIETLNGILKHKVMVDR